MPDQMHNKSKFSVLKLTGLLIAAAGLVLKVLFAVRYHDFITDWWGSFIFLYFALYGTSVFTMVSSFLKGTASLVTSIIVMILSCLLLFWDGILFLGFAIGLNSRTMIQVGVSPLVNLLNLAAGILCLIGAIRSRK